MSLSHKGTQTIETLRLVLRKFQAEDGIHMYKNWASSPEVCKYLSWGPHKTVDETNRRIMSWIHNYQYENFYVWAIELKTKHTPIGSISVEIANDPVATCEVGYCIGEQYWNSGIMTEALHTVMHYLFYEVGYEMIVAKHDVLNVASGRVMQKAGMQFLKIEYNVGSRRDGSRYDCNVYAKHIGDDN